MYVSGKVSSFYCLRAQRQTTPHHFFTESLGTHALIYLRLISTLMFSGFPNQSPLLTMAESTWLHLRLLKRYFSQHTPLNSEPSCKHQFEIIWPEILQSGQHPDCPLSNIYLCRFQSVLSSWQAFVYPLPNITLLNLVFSIGQSELVTGKQHTLHKLHNLF